MDSNNLIEGLLQKPLWQMTGEEYCQLTHYALSLTPNAGSSQAPIGQKAREYRAVEIIPQQHTGKEAESIDCGSQRCAAEQHEHQRGEYPRQRQPEEIADIEEAEPLWYLICGQPVEKFGEYAQPEAEQQREKAESQLLRQGFRRSGMPYFV